MIQQSSSYPWIFIRIMPPFVSHLLTSILYCLLYSLYIFHIQCVLHLFYLLLYMVCTYKHLILVNKQSNVSIEFWPHYPPPPPRHSATQIHLYLQRGGVNVNVFSIVLSLPMSTLELKVTSWQNTRYDFGWILPQKNLYISNYFEHSNCTDQYSSTNGEEQNTFR